MKCAILSPLTFLNNEIRFLAEELRGYSDFGVPVYTMSTRLELDVGLNAYPTHFTTPYGFLKPRKVTLDSVLNFFSNLLPQAEFDSVYLYGAGTHSEWVIDGLNSLGVSVQGVIVSRKSIESFRNLPVFALDEITFVNTKRPIVIFSSQSFEREMFHAFRAKHPTIECMGIYGPTTVYFREELRDRHREFYFELNADFSAQVVRWIDFNRPDVLINLEPSFSEVIGRANHRPLHVIEGDLDTVQKTVETLMSSFQPTPAPESPRLPRLIYVDHSLRNRVGHYFTYAHHVLKPAKGQFERYLLTNELLDTAFDEAEYVLPLFRYDFWGHDLLIDGRTEYPEASSDFIGKLNSVLRYLKPAKGDHIFIPNISDRALVALRDYLKTNPFSGCGLGLFVRYDLHSAYNRIEVMGEIKQLYPRTRFFTDTQELKEQHEQGGIVNVEVMPIPVAPTSASFALPRDAGKPLRVVSLGDARMEKGFGLLPRMIREFAAINPESEVLFEIQSYTSGSDPKVFETVAELERMSQDFPIILHPECLDDAQYAALIERGDILLCLYGPKVYARRSSHVFTEALCNGKELIALSGSSPANQLDSNCPWLVSDPQQVHLALDWIVRHRSESIAIRDSLAERFRLVSTGERLLSVICNTIP
jgi:hypothetical protein